MQVFLDTPLAVAKERNASRDGVCVCNVAPADAEGCRQRRQLLCVGAGLARVPDDVYDRLSAVLESDRRGRAGWLDRLTFSVDGSLPLSHQVAATVQLLQQWQHARVPEHDTAAADAAKVCVCVCVCVCTAPVCVSAVGLLSSVARAVLVQSLVSRVVVSHPPRMHGCH
jgi:hypothetical protein